MEINFNGMKLTVYGKYQPMIPGHGWGAWHGPTPDDPEDFEIEAIMFSGVDVYELLEGLQKNGKDCILLIVNECIRKAREGADND